MSRSSWQLTLAVVALLVVGSCGDGTEDAPRAGEPPRVGDQEAEQPSPVPGPKPSTPQPEPQPGDPSPAATPAPAGEEPSAPAPHVACAAPEGVDDDPRSFEAVVALINSLPKPLSIACFVEALARPLRVNATSSVLSVQEAAGLQSPRLFLFADPLLMGIVPEGAGGTLLELSLLRSTQRSVKGEIVFPVEAALELGTPYDQVRRRDKDGTRCAACHADEVAGVPAGYVSRALRPKPDSDVPLSKLRGFFEACGNNSTERCDVFRALFGGGEVEPYTFPLDMPTMF